jgi:hypothetical protein
MKLRSLFLFGAGVITGLTIAKKLTEDDEDIARGPRHAARASAPLSLITSQTQRMSDRATVASLDAIRRTREAIRERLRAQDLDDATWN